MPKDQFGDRWDKKQKKGLLGSLRKKNIDPELLDEEEEILANTSPVEPIQNDGKPGRNDPCPCGNGKKFKKCCEGKD